MKFTREQVIQMAREVGFDLPAKVPVFDYDDVLPKVRKLERLCTLAADRALEAAAVEASKLKPSEPNCVWEAAYAVVTDEISTAIRSMKEPAQ